MLCKSRVNICNLHNWPYFTRHRGHPVIQVLSEMASLLFFPLERIPQFFYTLKKNSTRLSLTFSAVLWLLMFLCSFSLSLQLVFVDVEKFCCVVRCCGCWHGTLLWKQQWWSLCGEERSPPGTNRGTAHSGFSAAQLVFPISHFHSPPSLSSYSLVAFCLLHSSFIFLFFPSLVFCFSPSLPLLCLYLYPYPGLFLSLSHSSSQFHPFFYLTKTAIHPWLLKENKNLLWKRKACTEMPSQSQLGFLL